jgi:O-antigen ligase/tetratricopeptide (TPR) repeat protein
LVDFVPEWGAVDIIGPQWVYLVVINLISTTCIYYFYQKHGYEAILKKIFRNFLPQAYLAFFVLAGISIFFAINPTEGLVCYACLATSLIAFFNIAILLGSNISAFKVMAQIIAIILLIQAINTLSTFLKGMNETPLHELILSLKGNTGNKNIFAASLAVKLSFVMYCVYTFKSWVRVIYIPTLAIGTISLLLISARSAYLGLLLQVGIFIAFTILQFFKERKGKESLVKAGSILIPILFSFFITQALLNSAQQMSNTTPSGFGSITDRLESITSKTAGSNAGRLKLWVSGIDYIKKNPIMGAGYGNCKLAIVPYENHFMQGFEFNQHLHNDFIETAMELGVLGGLLFISLFIGALLGVINIWKSKANDQLKTIALFSLMALAGYGIDAFFNFPSERPIMQLLFSLVLAIHVSVLINRPEEKVTTDTFKNTYIAPLLGGVCIILLVFSGYYRYATYQSLVAQSLTIPDFPNQATHSWEEINDKLPSIPNLDANNTPVDVVKAWYLSKDAKYDEALKLLNKSTRVNPYNLSNEFVKAQIFLQTNRLDSALHYANKGFQTRPANIGFYIMLNELYKQRGDTSSIKNTFQKCIKYLNTAAVWDNYIGTLMSMHYSEGYLLATMDAALKLFPDDKSIQEKKLLVKSNHALNTAEIQTALAGFMQLAKINPTHYYYLENVGVCYFELKKYEQALPYLDQVIATKAYANGRSEFFKGLCLFNLGKKQEACSYLTMAGSKNYPGAIGLVSTYCK